MLGRGIFTTRGFRIASPNRLTEEKSVVVNERDGIDINAFNSVINIIATSGDHPIQKVNFPYRLEWAVRRALITVAARGHQG